jgi:hypothetical protein
MSRTIALDSAAQSDLDSIYDYFFAHNPAAADRYIRLRNGSPADVPAWYMFSLAPHRAIPRHFSPLVI